MDPCCLSTRRDNGVAALLTPRRSIHPLRTHGRHTPLQLYLPPAAGISLTNGETGVPPQSGVLRRLVRWLRTERRSSLGFPSTAQPTGPPAETCALGQHAWSDCGADGELGYTVALAFLLML
jgi:hypothetical protein